MCPGDPQPMPFAASSRPEKAITQARINASKDALTRIDRFLLYNEIRSDEVRKKVVARVEKGSEGPESIREHSITPQNHLLWVANSTGLSALVVVLANSGHIAGLHVLQWVVLSTVVYIGFLVVGLCGNNRLTKSEFAELSRARERRFDLMRELKEPGKHKKEASLILDAVESCSEIARVSAHTGVLDNQLSELDLNTEMMSIAHQAASIVEMSRTVGRDSVDMSDPESRTAVHSARDKIDRMREGLQSRVDALLTHEKALVEFDTRLTSLKAKKGIEGYDLRISAIYRNYVDESEAARVRISQKTEELGASTEEIIQFLDVVNKNLPSIERD